MSKLDKKATSRIAEILYINENRYQHNKNMNRQGLPWSSGLDSMLPPVRGPRLDPGQGN